MSTDFPRNKGKRVRSTSSTEVNNSFVKTVTSRVSGLLPATISKWFSSPSSSSANGSGPPNEATDSSTDDEAAENITMTQPPMKKMRFSSNASSSSLNNNYELLETTSQTFEASKTTELCNTFSVIQSPPGKNTFRRETNFVSTPLKAADAAPDDRNEKDKIYFTPQLTVSQIGRSIEKKRKSLFNSFSQATNDSTKEACKKSSLSTMKDTKQPSFKASLLGSPFYAGRTMYGGAASSLYINQPNIKQTKVAVVSASERSSADNSVSHAARRVLDLLEHYSSPLIEAKRIPPYTRPKLSESLSLNASRESSISERSSKVKSYKTQELHVPSIASFLRVKQRSRLMDSTTAARQIIASQSSTSEFIPYPAQTQRNSESERHSLTTKVTSRLTRPRRGEASDMNTDVAAPIELPTAVLKINKDDLPKFSFAATIVTNSASVLPKPGTSTDPKIPGTLPKHTEALTIPKMTVDNLTKNAIHNVVSESNTFKFSSPIRITKEHHQLNSTQSSFVFGSPERTVDEATSVSSVVGGLTETGNTLTTPTNKSNDWNCADCWVNNKPEADKCVCCGGVKPAQGSATSKKCSLCKIANAQLDAEQCIDCENVDSKLTTAIKLPVAAPANKWTCEACWVKNDDSVDKCVCCGSQNTKLNAVASKATTQPSSEKPWRCADCWVDNKRSAAQCAACGAAPPGAPAGTSAASAASDAALKPASDSLLSKIAKSQSEKWECASCLVKNENLVMKCVCCETPKPGSGTDLQKKFNFGVSNTTFKFGIPAANPSPAVAADKDKAAFGEKGKTESEKNNNNLPSTPNLTFGIPTAKTDSATLPTNDTTPVVSFKFGQPSAPPAAQAPADKPALDGFKFAAPAKDAPQDTTVIKEKEVEQEVPKVKEQPSTGASTAVPAAPAAPAASAATATFEYFASGTDNLNKKTTAENPLPTNFTSFNNKPSGSIASDKSTSFDVPKNNFMFSSGSGITNVSTAAANSLNATSITFTPVKPAPLPTTLFTKNDSPNATIGFSKTDITPPSTTTSTANFSFGSNLTSETKSEIKPKFNISFGGTKTDAPQGFNASFGSSPAASFPLGSGAPAAAPSPANGGVANAADNAAKGSLFGSLQKENVWPSPVLNNNSANNMFASNTQSTNNLQKPATFSFGASTSFSSGNVNQTPAFGNNSANNTLPAFGSSTTTPTFGNNQQGAGAIAAFGSNPQVPNTMPSFGTNQQTTGIMPSFSSNQNAGLTPAFGQQTAGLATTFSSNQQASASPFGNSQQNTISSSAFGTGQQSSSTPFGSSLQQGAGSAPAFGAGAQAGVNSTPTPVFGVPTTTNVFGMSSSNGSNQPSLFSNPVQNQAGPMFGSGHGGQGAGLAMFGAGGAGGAAPAFGSAPAAAVPAFGSSNAAMPAFEAPAMAPTGTTAFNFGTPQNNAMFGFRQQQPAGVYNFGSAPGTSPQVQFNMGISTGSAPAPQSLANRKIRKATRRTTQR